MSEFRDAVEVLRKLGFSDYEAKAYAALLAMGELTPREISSATNIPYTKVYDALKKLEARGWATVVSRSPLVYAPKKVEEAIAIEKRKIEERLKEAEEKLKTLEKAGSVATGIYVIRNFTALIKAIRNLLADSSEVYMVISSERLFENIKSLISKGKVKGVIDIDMQAPRYGEWRKAQLNSPLDIIIADSSKLILHFSLLSLHEKTSGVLVLDREIASAATEYFMRIWNNAENPGMAESIKK